MCSSQVKIYHNPLVIVQQYITECVQTQKQTYRSKIDHCISNIFTCVVLVLCQNTLVALDARQQRKIVSDLPLTVFVLFCSEL